MPTIDYGVFVWPGSSNASVGTNDAAIPTSSTLVGGSDGTTLRPIKTDATGIVQAAVTSSVLPTGAATSANQTSGSQKTQISDSSGNAVTIRHLNDQPVNGDWALETISVTHGLSTLGNQYIDVKVNSSTNAMLVDASSATVTVTGTVAATQSGTWGVGLNAGSNIVGKVGIDQTTPGTTNGVQVNAALPAGSNIIGKTGIDQTTPGTTNAVSLAQVGSTTVATGNGVVGTGVQRVAIASDNTAFTVNAAQSGTWGVGLNAGSNLVGKFGIDQTTPGTTNAISLAQVGSTTVATGNGVAGTGVQRVTIASDNTAFSVNAAQSGTWNIGTLTSITNAVTVTGTVAATQSGTWGVGLNAGTNLVGKVGIDQTTPGTTNAISLAQVGSTTVATGNGVAGTGVQRVTIASDNTAFTVNAAQSGTWTVQPGNTANTTAWLITQDGRSKANAPAYNDYSTGNVTTSAYTQLVASLTSACSEIEIFDSSGQGMILATGGAGSETDQIYIFPGGNGRVPLKIAASTRVAIKAKTASATSGYIMINFYA